MVELQRVEHEIRSRIISPGAHMKIASVLACLPLAISVACSQEPAKPQPSASATPPATAAPTGAQKPVLTGAKAFVSSTEITPGTVRRITAADLPQPYATESVATRSRIVPRPD